MDCARTAAIGIVLVGACLLTTAAEAVTHRVSGIACKPFAIPEINWSNWSYTGYGPGNHAASSQALLCPVTSFPSQTTAGVNYEVSGYDRDPSNEVVATPCAYDRYGTGMVCAATMTSGVLYVGPFYGATPFAPGPIPSDAHFMLWVEVPAIWTGNVSHLTQVKVTQ